MWPSGEVKMDVRNQKTKVRIQVTPGKCLVDDELQIVVTDLVPKQTVTLACCVLESDVKYFSFGIYTADSDGRVDVGKMAAESGGSYEGVEPMGLIWSQKQDPKAKAGRRLAKFDVTTPIVTDFYVIQDLVRSYEVLDFIARGQWDCTTSCERWYLGDGVERLPIREGRLQGTLFIPKGAGPFPGVLDLFGTIGGLTEHRAALLASRGIAAFALIYFTPGVGSGLISDMEYFEVPTVVNREGAVDYMLKHPRVMKPYAGVIGVSQGAMLALLLSSVCQKIKACIEINGGPGVNLVDHSYKGEIFKCFDFDLSNIQSTDEGLLLRPIFDNVLSKYEQLGSVVPMERSDCSFLLIHGEVDACVSVPAIPDLLTMCLDAAGKTDYELLIYPGAGHLLEPPHSPLFYSTYYALYNNLVIWGGEPKQHARAQEQSWKRTLNFFKMTLSKANSPSTDSKL